MSYESVDEIEAELRLVGRILTAPRPEECLHCYVERMVDHFGCPGTHRFTLAWDDAQPTPVKNLLPRLADHGGCCCDCEVLLNAYREGRRGPRGRLASCRQRPRR